MSIFRLGMALISKTLLSCKRKSALRGFAFFEGETRNGVEIIKECAKDICYFVDLLNKGKLEATKKKYSTDALYNVASLMFISK